MPPPALRRSATAPTTGPAASLHRGWKVAQTLIEIWSGVATATRAIVCASVSPLLFGRRLWAETRIELFELTLPTVGMIL